ncbi:hypothetical protein IFM89_020565 [Coptis chinensis]|uniref:SANT domain-containing protein n=1 Tax=Coptis chinensis TaxID=261450 RepID=A0A835IDK8_9MAGN|nr:hypothetical protein IFM89_020565 [Coptis chinensis]
MDPVVFDHDEEFIIEDTSHDHVFPEGCPDLYDIFGDPHILPRVGDQYQVEIPPVMTEWERLQLMKNPADTQDTDEKSFLLGLPIPIVWAHEQVDNKEINKNRSRESENGEQAVVMDMELPSLRLEEPILDQMHSNKDHYPLPYSVGSSWSNVEIKSFLLGLYIFGRNLVLVERFVESKDMGDILSYYYGKFYRSDSYLRWSECRKIRSKKCIHGQRIFTGWRQQELLSRLLPHDSKGGQNTLVELSKTFGEGKISLEDYVFTLKFRVGMNALIDAIGIGKGKQDLTGIVDPIKTTRPEIPTGKECNSLSPGDILKYLIGDFRLSKARSNDLFWEAVWPRLLARGWHSEQPRNHGYVGSKHSLVFLVPGVKKFSKRRLVKGNHYFDSVSDVLNKVTADPRLLEVEIESPKSGGSKEENGWNTELKFDENSPSDGPRQCYLQPRLSNCKSEIVEFTVVDTSLVHGEGPLKVRELRTLPGDTTVISPTTSASREIDADSSEEPEAHSNSNTSKRAENFVENGVCIDQSDCLLGESIQGRLINDLDTTSVPMKDHENQNEHTCNDKHARKNLKAQSSRRVNSSNYLSPIMKRQKLTACGNEETCGTNVLVSQLKAEDLCLHLDSPGSSETMVGLSQEEVFTGSSGKGSSGDSSEGTVGDKVERRPLIDLNLPHLLQDFENSELVTTEVADSKDDPMEKETSLPTQTNQLEDSQTLETSTDVIIAVQQPAGRRQSTRNRPLTTKALEALACGYLSTNRKPRSAKSMLEESSYARPSRRTRGRGVVKEKVNDVANGVVDCMAEGFDKECSSYTNIVSNSQFWSERRGSHDLLGVANPACHTELLASKD